jgi:hypothetical protein
MKGGQAIHVIIDDKTKLQIEDLLEKLENVVDEFRKGNPNPVVSYLATKTLNNKMGALMVECTKPIFERENIIESVPSFTTGQA